eukprot:tig00000718_g3707.t1
MLPQGRPRGSAPPSGIVIGADIEPATGPCDSPSCGGSRKLYGGKCLHCGQHFCTRDALYSHVPGCRAPAPAASIGRPVGTRSSTSGAHAFSERPECGDCQQKSKATGSKDVWGCDLCAAHFVRFGPAKVVAHRYHATASFEKGTSFSFFFPSYVAGDKLQLVYTTFESDLKDGHVHFIPQQYTREYVITAKDEKTQALDALYDAFRNGTATLQSGPKSCLVMPAPPAPIAALPAPQLPEDDDEDTPKHRSGGRKATVISSDESDNASATGDDPIEVSSDEEGAAPELDAAEAPVVKSASAPKKATGMKGLMALAAPRLLGTKAARLLGAGVSKGKKTKKTAAPKAAKSKDTKGGKKTKAVR